MKSIKINLLWILVVVALLLLFILNNCWQIVALHPFYAQDEHDIRVMTWNIHCSMGTDDNSQVEIANFAVAQKADIVLLNECNIDSCRTLDSLLRKQYTFIAEKTGHANCGDMVYSKLPLYHSRRISSGVPGKPVQHISTTFTLHGDSIFFIGVHLPSNSGKTESNKITYQRYKEMQEQRNWCMSLIKRWVLEHNHPTIVMGDMNDFNCTPPLDTLTSIGMKDSWWEGGFGYGTTFHSGWMRLRIDHIFHSKELELTKVKVIPTNLSDHNLVVAEFRMRKED